MRTPDWLPIVLAGVARACRPWLVNLPLQEDPYYRPAGAWCVTRPIAGKTPLLFAFPQPLHPLECLAAIGGFGGWSYERCAMESLAARRGVPWVPFTAILAEYLKLTPQQVRQAFHVLTPLTVAGDLPSWMPRSVPGGPVRENFLRECGL